MGNKLRVGMLCKFKQNRQSFWTGHADAKNKTSDVFFWENELDRKFIRFSKRHVTIVNKAGSLQEGKWVSVCQVLGIDMAGNSITGWVLSHKLKMSAIPE